MFDYLRNLRKSEEEKRQEMLSAYLDDTLTAADKQRFERLLASDDQLRASLEEQRLIKASLSRLPRMRAPRNFTLDPAAYGAPVVSTADRLYPIMRVATAAVALLFVMVLVLDFVSFGADQEAAQPLAEQVQDRAFAIEVPAEEAPGSESEPVSEGAVEVTRVVEVAEEALEMAAEEIVSEEAMAEEAAPEEPAAAEVVEEEVEVAAEAEAPLPSPDEVMGGGAPPDETPSGAVELPAEDGFYAAPETVTAEDRAGEPDRPLLATAQARLPFVASGTDETKEAAVQPTASPEAQALFHGGQALDEAAMEQMVATEPARGLSTNRVLAILFGTLFVVLIVVTLLLRRQTI